MKLGKKSVFIIFTILLSAFFFSACSSPAPENEPEDAAPDYNAALCELYNDVTGLMPEPLTESMRAICSSPDGSGVILVSGSDPFSFLSPEEAYRQSRLAILKPVAVSLLEKEAGYASAIRSDYTDETKSSVLGKIESCETVDSLYHTMLGFEKDLFHETGSDEGSADKQLMDIGTFTYTDADLHTWLLVCSNFPLPSLNDGAAGFSLELNIDNGKTLRVLADSIGNNKGVRCYGAYCVGFDLNEILGSVSPESFFCARNRVIFSYFRTDNSFGITKEIYRFSDSEPEAENYFEAYIDLLRIICKYC